MKNRIIDTDVLIIGGGTAGCFAGITLGKKKDLDVLIVEKANIVRSGCLAAGVNCINTCSKTAASYNVSFLNNQYIKVFLLSKRNTCKTPCRSATYNKYICVNNSILQPSCTSLQNLIPYKHSILVCKSLYSQFPICQ